MTDEQPIVASWPLSETMMWYEFSRLMTGLPFGDHQQLVRNLGLFSTPGLIRRLLMFHHLTGLAVDVPGLWVEFGVRWGRDLAWWIDLRSLHRERTTDTTIVGFDTFTGHTGTSLEDGESDNVADGAFGVPEGYEAFLAHVLEIHRRAYGASASTELVVGDVRETLPAWLDNSPHPVAFAYLDLDLYEPTRFVLQNIWDRVPAGGVIGLDEYCSTMYPGETVAVAETIGFGVRWRKSPFGDWAYLVKP